MQDSTATAARPQASVNKWAAGLIWVRAKGNNMWHLTGTREYQAIGLCGAVVVVAKRESAEPPHRPCAKCLLKRKRVIEGCEVAR